MIDRVNAVLIGQVRDREGFRAELLEDPLTGSRMLAYTPEEWWSKCEYQKLQATRPQRDNTPRHAWPARTRR